MSRWDDGNFDSFGYQKPIDYEETRLLKKFDDYRELEIRELQKRNPSKISNNEKPGAWTNRFMFLTVIQAIIIAGFTIPLMFMEFINSEIKILVLLLTLTVLGGEIVFLSKYIKNKSVMKTQVSIPYEPRTEFDRI